MKKLFFYTAFLLTSYFTLAQSTSNYINNLPDFLPPTPDAAAIMKADQLNVGYTTGSPNITIPLYKFQAGSYTLPISLNYSSTGVKVDEVASSVGMGWSLNAGGVISRVVFDRPDEYRNTSNCNLNTLNPDVHDQTWLNFLKNAPDKQSDIFSFSFPGGSGKFIIGLNGLPVQLTTLNLKIDVVNSNFLNGFIITTDDGTAYSFTEAEVVSNREPLGNNCGKTYNNSNFKSSWYLTKIELPSKNKWIDLEYTTSDIAYESSISQTISKVIYSQTNYCNGSGSYICPVGTTNFSTCIYKQLTAAKFVSKIISSDGDYMAFNYDTRTDLQGGKRLSLIAVFNRNHLKLQTITFSGTYYSAVNTTNSGIYLYPTAASQRLFLNSVAIKGTELNTSVSELIYSFLYNSPSSLPVRLSYAQDFYGYYNGKTTNGSLIPTLSSSDVNYSAFPPSGSSAGSIQFGDRSVDPAYSSKGLLTRINYPTGGYDLITYQANVKQGGVLTGGHSVSKITTYTSLNEKAGEREFFYEFKDNGNPSALVLTNDLVFSTTKKTYQAFCSYTPDVNNPVCTHAVITSNANNPLSVMGGQHIYYQTVLEKYRSANGDNGMTEHLYSYFAGGNLNPRLRMGNRILTAPFEIVPDFLKGETITNVYKSNGSSYDLVKKTERSFRLENLTEFYNYVVNVNYDYFGLEGTPPIEAQFMPYDVEQVYVNCYVPRLDWVEETEYLSNGSSSVTRTDYEYNNGFYTYPNKIKTLGSDNIERRVERKYPPDLPAYTFMVNRNIISPVMEETTYKGTGTSNLLATKTQHYIDWFNDSKVIAPDWVNLTLRSNTSGQKVQFFAYDNMGNVTDLAKENDARIAYVWDYGKTYVTAKVTGASAADVAYTSFEGDGWGNWLGGDPSKIAKDAYGPTGYRHYSGSNLYLSKTGLTSSTAYLVSYWSKGSALTVSGTQSGWPKALRTITMNGQAWTLYVHRVTGLTTVSISGSGSIDELRLYPETAQMTSFTWEPLVGITSSSDASNQLSYYEYDLMGRLSIVRDEDRNILKKYCYNYQGQPEICDYFYNAAASQNFTKQCSSGYVGSSVTYTVPAGRYSGQTQAEADAKAQSEITFKGQAFADQNGTCHMSCTNPACTGEDKKCVYGHCETGIKVITSSVKVHASLWQCTYHYEWSDGSWSPNYTEYSSTMCFSGPIE
jgi:hypothetical protein